MSQVRVAQRVLEAALHLPLGVSVVGTDGFVEQDGECFLVFRTTGCGSGFPAEGRYALRYDIAQGPPQFVAAIPD